MLELFLKKLTTNSETKPFYATSEFYVFVGAEVTSLGGLLPTSDAKLQSAIAAVAAVAYAISRGLAKAGVKPS